MIDAGLMVANAFVGPLVDTSAATSEPSAEVYEAGLVRRCQSQEQAACQELVERYKDDAFRLAYRLLQNVEDAKDASQEAFVRLFRSLHKFRFNASVKTWLYRIVTNSCIDFLRRQKRRSDAPLEQADLLPAADSDPTDAALREETAAQVRRVIGALPIKYRVVLTLRELEGLSCEEVAKTLRIPQATVRWRLHRARKLFKTRWEQLVTAKEGEAA